MGGGDDSLAGREGNDEIWAMSGSDQVWGGGGDDVIGGGPGRDSLSGGEGADSLTGGTDDDRLQGMAGADVFVFKPGHGHDRIIDFEPGLDRIEIAGGIGFPSLTIQQTESGSEISSAFGTIILDGIAPDQLIFGDFLFI